MCPLCAGRRVLRLCSVLPPTGGAGSLRSCKNRYVLQPAAHHSSGSDRGGSEGAPKPARPPGLTRHKRAWGRSLSPLERISSMIPPELLSREVQDLQSEGGDTQLHTPSSVPGYSEDGGANGTRPPSSSHSKLDNGGVIGMSHPSSSTPGYFSHKQPDDGDGVTPQPSSSTLGYSHGEPDVGGVISMSHPSSSTLGYSSHGELDNGGVIGASHPSSTPRYSSHRQPYDEGIISTPQPSPSTPGYSHGELDNGGVIGASHPSSAPRYFSQRQPDDGTPRPASSTPGYTHEEPNVGGIISKSHPSSSTPGYSSHGEPDNAFSGQDKSSSVFDTLKPPSFPPGYTSHEKLDRPPSSTPVDTTHGNLDHGGAISTPQLSAKEYTTHGEPHHGFSKQDNSFKVFAAPNLSSSPQGYTQHGEAADGGVLTSPLQETMSTPQPPSALSGYASHVEAALPQTSPTPQPQPSLLSPKEKATPTQTPCSHLESDTHEEGGTSPLLGTPFTPGDLLLAEYKRRHYSMFRKMFVLKEHGKLVSNWGAIRNQEIVGKLPGQRLCTSTGHEFLLRRPSLEEYVGYMKRGPNIAYPKDMTAMMTMMDISPGDVVLEAGSGSGAFSLFLSRAVGAEGCVYSFDIRTDHHDIAKKNFQIWRKAWQIRSGRSWPDNVRFINKSILDASPDITPLALDAAVLDMLNPQIALPVITRNLKQGAVCAVYIANITQVIDLLEAIRSGRLPLMCEKVIEVGLTQWLVAPARRKDGSLSRRVDPFAREELATDDEDREETDEEEELSARSQAFGQLPYIARPLPWQTGHTAFLVHLRKFKPAPPTEPQDSS